MSTVNDLRLTVAWFDTATPDGPAYGDPETTTWGNFASIFRVAPGEFQRRLLLRPLAAPTGTGR